MRKGHSHGAQACVRGDGGSGGPGDADAAVSQAGQLRLHRGAVAGPESVFSDRQPDGGQHNYGDYADRDRRGQPDDPGRAAGWVQLPAPDVRYPFGGGQSDDHGPGQDRRDGGGFSTGAVATNNSTNQLYDVEVWVTVQTAGAGGTAFIQGAWKEWTTTGATNNFAMANTSATSFNTTVAHTIDIGFAWSAASASNSVTSTNVYLNQLR